MRSSATNKPEFLAKKVVVDDQFIHLFLTDGREIKTPIEFYSKLRNATSEDRKSFRLIGNGAGIHWDKIDEDLSVEGIVLGIKS